MLASLAPVNFSLAPPDIDSHCQHQHRKDECNHLRFSMRRKINDHLLTRSNFIRAFAVVHDGKALSLQMLEFLEGTAVWSDKRPAASCPTAYPDPGRGRDFNFVPGVWLGDDVAYFGLGTLQIIACGQPCVDRQEDCDCGEGRGRKVTMGNVHGFDLFKFNLTDLLDFFGRVPKAQCQAGVFLLGAMSRRPCPEASGAANPFHKVRGSNGACSTTIVCFKASAAP